MWHPIAFVAESRRVDADALTEYARANSDRFGIVEEFGYPEVNTWHVDDFVKSFKEANNGS